MGRKKIRNECFEFLAAWSKNSAAYFKKTFVELEVGGYKGNEEEEVEVGFVDGLFELYKLRKEITKARSEIIAYSAISTSNQKFGTYIFGCHMDYRSSLNESLIEPKRTELDKQKKMEASVIAYELLF